MKSGCLQMVIDIDRHHLNKPARPVLSQTKLLSCEIDRMYIQLHRSANPVSRKDPLCRMYVHTELLWKDPVIE